MLASDKFAPVRSTLLRSVEVMMARERFAPARQIPGNETLQNWTAWRSAPLPRCLATQQARGCWMQNCQKALGSIMHTSQITPMGLNLCIIDHLTAETPRWTV